MKKVLLIIAVLFLVAGCGAKEKTLTCELSSNDVVNGYSVISTYKVYYTGKEVDKVSTIEEVTSDLETVLDYFEELTDDTYSKMNENYGGYTYDIDRDTNKVTTTVDIDYNKLDMDAFVKDQPTLEPFVTKNGKLKIEGLKQTYESMGAKCNS